MLKRGSLPFFMVFLLFSRVALAIPQFSFETTDLIPVRSRKVIEQTVQVAVHHVRELPPRRENPFRSSSSRKIHFVLTTSADSMSREIYDVSTQVADSDDSDAFTFTIGHGGELITMIFLIMDRLVWDPSTGNQRPDGYARILAALGHEIYGNVVDQLKLEFGNPPPPATFESRRQDEIAAFQAGVAFLERYLVSNLWRGFPAGTKRSVQEALGRERTSLESWVSAREGGCAERVSRRVQE